MIEPMIETNVSTLTIHKFDNEEQHQKAIAAGKIAETDICLVPDDDLPSEYLTEHLENISNPHRVTARQIGAASLSDVGSSIDSFNLGASLLVENSYVDARAEKFTGKDGCSLYTFPLKPGRTLRIKTYAFEAMGYMLAYPTKQSPEYPSFYYKELNPTISEEDIQKSPELGICEFEVEVPENATDAIDFQFSFYNNEYLSEPVGCIKRGTAWDEIKALDDKIDSSLAEHLAASNPHNIMLNTLRSENGTDFYECIDNCVSGQLANGLAPIEAKLDELEEKVDNFDDSNLQFRSITYEANTENILTVLANAQPNSTVKLAAGEYPLLALKGKSAFPDNLTIQGASKSTVKIAGLSITGGQTNTSTWVSDTSAAVMPKNLVIKDITFTDTVNIKNGIYDGLAIRGCDIKNGISIVPNHFKGKYDAGGNTDGSTDRYTFQATKGKNILIRECKIDGYDSTYGANYGILAVCCDNVSIYYNTINNAGTYPISVRGATPTKWRTVYCGGLVSICRNTINGAAAPFISVSKLRNADIQITNNSFKDYTGSTGNYISIDDCIDYKTLFARQKSSSSNQGNNKYTDDAGNVTYLSEDEGISITSSDNYVTSSGATSIASSVTSPVSTRLNTHLYSSNPHGITAEGLGINKEKLVLTSRTINVTTSDNLATVIKNAQDGAIINLAAGTYPRLTLSGRAAFKNNITITGSINTKINGVSISSGLGMLDDLQTHRDCDIKRATLGSNLTFDSVAFTKPFCVKNCIIDGLSVVNCTFDQGALLEVVPSMSLDSLDMHIDHDNGNGDATFRHVPEYATRYAKNVLVKGCIFKNANLASTVSAIYMKSIDGAYIMENDIQAAAHNGIQIAGVYESNRFNARSTGKISITKNTISNTGDRAINLHGLDDADIRILYNKLTNIHTDTTDKDASELQEYIRVSNINSATKVSTKFAEQSGTSVETNTYRPSELDLENNPVSWTLISSGSGIYISSNASRRKTELEKVVEELRENGLASADVSSAVTKALAGIPRVIAQQMDPDNEDHPGWTWRKWSNGTVEMWFHYDLNFTYNDYTMCLQLPCELYDIHNLLLTHPEYESCTFDYYLQDSDADVITWNYLWINALFYEFYDEVEPTIDVYIVGKY